MEKKLFKSPALQVKATDDAARTIQGYAATYGNIDSYGDKIMPGAFADSLKQRLPKMLSQHDTSCVIGIWNKATEDGNGLLVDGMFADTSDGNDTYTLAKMGALDALSIGYTVTDAEYMNINDQNVRILKAIDLWEVSIVTFPANDQAVITSVKSAPDNERDFEKLLRDAGYPREAAKIITARGFKALGGQREAEAVGLSVEHAAELMAMFKSFNNNLSH